MNTSEAKDPADLRPHSILASIPAPAKDAPEVCACADTIREQDGHMLPIVIDEENHILTDDSRLRWMAARRQGLSEVPVVIQSGALAPVIALNAIIHRGHYTKSAIAYLAIPMLKPAFESARAVRLQNLRNAKDSSIAHGVGYAQNLDDLAKSIGVSPALLDAAKQVRAEFEKDKKQYDFEVEGGADDGKVVKQTLREHFEPKILRQQVDSEHAESRPIGLGGVLKAIGSKRKYANELGGHRPESNQLELFVGGLSNRFRYWDELTADQKRQAREKMRAWLMSMPDEAREALLKEARDLEKARN